MKRSKTLLNHIRREWPGLEKRWRASLAEISIKDFFVTADEFIRKSKRTQDGREVYDLPVAVLDLIVELRRETKRKWARAHRSRKKTG